MNSPQDWDSNMSVYTDNGYESREDYLDALADEYGEDVYFLADMLGVNEDFDGLIVALEDL